MTKLKLSGYSPIWFSRFLKSICAEFLDCVLFWGDKWPRISDSANDADISHSICISQREHLGILRIGYFSCQRARGNLAVSVHGWQVDPPSIPFFEPLHHSIIYLLNLGFPAHRDPEWQPMHSKSSRSLDSRWFIRDPIWEVGVSSFSSHFYLLVISVRRASATKMFF
jgi:hypothetical protein